MRLLRSEVAIEETWDLTDLFSSDTEWERELEAIQQDLATVVQYKGRLQDRADVLLACLEANEALAIRMMRAFIYASLLSSGDGTDPVNQGNSARVAGVLAQVNASLSFLKSEILEISEESLATFLEEEPKLQDFKKYLLDIHTYKPYQLSPETETVLASLGEVFDSPYMIYQRSKASDMQFSPIQDEHGKELPLSFALFEDRYELEANTELRRKAYQAFTDGLSHYKNTFAATYATEVKKQVTLAKLRGYSSVTEMLLQPQQVTEEMYHNQLDIIQTELAPHMRRYATLKKRVLGLDTMLFCDLKAPLDPDYNPKTSYAEATSVILDSLQILGSEYMEIMERAFAERWVDRSDNVGKATGAFCSSPYGVHPYILITWTDTMRGAFVLTHELGHAGHFALAGRYQRMTNTRPSTYFIEAPSTMNELLLGKHLLAKTTVQRMKRWIISQLLGTYYHNFVTHLLEGELQRRVYALAEAGRPITAKTLCEQKGEVLSSFWGDAVEIDEAAQLTWMRQPHYYMGLYPYTYSAGLTASTAIVQLIEKEGQPAIDRWLEVLKAGGTKTPLELMKHAGVDMSKPDAIRSAVQFVGTLVDELEKSFE